jgi:Flp pilus assembly pilin Flp
LVSDEPGPAAIEYGLMPTLIAVAIITTATVATHLRTRFTNIGNGR